MVVQESDVSCSRIACLMCLLNEEWCVIIPLHCRTTIQQLWALPMQQIDAFVQFFDAQATWFSRANIDKVS